MPKSRRTDGRWDACQAKWLRCVAFGGLCLLLCSACDESPPQPGDAQPKPAVANGSDGEATAVAAKMDDLKSADETWDVIYMQDSPIGYAHVARKSIEEDGKKQVQVTGTVHVEMKRLGDTVEIHQIAQTVEKPNGDLIRFRSETHLGPSAIVVTGERSGDKMKNVTTIRDSSSTHFMDWKPTYRGFFEVERSLRESPMKPGETRTIHELSQAPSGVVMSENTLQAKFFEATKLLSETRQLLRIESTIKIGNSSLEAVLWTDRDGFPWKSQLTSLGETLYRTTKEVALKSTDSPTFDIGTASIVKVDRAWENPHSTGRVEYLATLQHQDPTKTFFNGPSQSVTRVDDRTAKIVVRSIRPDQPAEAENDDVQPSNADLAPSTLIQSNDQRVVEMAAAAALDESDVWSVAKALERHVRQTVQVRNYTQTFASAADVAEQGEGDCTEHAVLLAALCRARKIPARVATGLVYVDSLGGFAFHMWTEAWIKDRWIPIDATLGQGGIGAAHIKLAHSSLADGTDFDAFLPVAQVLGQLDLKIVAVE